MSALGHKQTYAVQQPMSALPPIATAKADFRTTSCLLYPQKRTCAVHQPMSALGQKRTSSTLFNHLIGAASYSITSSARASSVGGIVKRSALAAFRFMTKSNFSGCCTGSSDGLAPLKILST